MADQNAAGAFMWIASSIPMLITASHLDLTMVVTESATKTHPKSRDQEFSNEPRSSLDRQRWLFGRLPRVVSSSMDVLGCSLS